jgi:hypothetical protein
MPIEFPYRIPQSIDEDGLAWDLLRLSEEIAKAMGGEDKVPVIISELIDNIAQNSYNFTKQIMEEYRDLLERQECGIKG